jgi:hypothetical protein
MVKLELLVHPNGSRYRGRDGGTTKTWPEEFIAHIVGPHDGAMES